MAELFRKIVDGKSQYAIWKITESEDELRAAVKLNAREEEIYNRFMVESRKKQWLAYRILLRQILAPAEITIEYDSSGKPYLAESRMHISVTHSEDLAAVIISPEKKVGIDIERMRPRIFKVKDKFLNDKELSTLISENELEQLTLAWCAKEALYKLYGMKNLDFRENILLDLPTQAAVPFTGTIRTGAYSSSFTIKSEKLGEFILVYIVEPETEG